MKGFVSFITAPFKYAWSGLKTALKGVLAVVGSIAAGAYAAKKALDPAGKMESYQVQLDVLLKSPAASKRRLAELSRYAKQTNFSPEEVIGAGNQLQSFGMYNFRTLRLAGDAANAFGKPLSDVVHSLAYLKGGRTGEAMESLTRFGVTRDKMKAEGIRFKKSGEMSSSPEDALKAVLNIFEKEYGGMTKRIGKTWTGALQQLGGEIFDAMSRGMGKALQPATAFVTGSLIPAIEKFGNFLQSVDWGSLLAGPIGTGSAILAAAGNFADPRTRQIGKDQFMDLWSGFKSVGEALLTGAGKIFSGFIESFAKTLGNFVSSDGMGALFNAGITTLQAVIQAGCATFKTIVASMSPELQMTVESILEKIPGLDYKGTLSSKFQADYDKERALMQSSNVLPAWASEDLKGEMYAWMKEKYNSRTYSGEGYSYSYKDIFGGKDFEHLSSAERESLWKVIGGSFDKEFRSRLKSEWIASEKGNIQQRNQSAINAEWTSAGEKANAAFANVKGLASTFGSSVTFQPLLDRTGEAVKGVSDAWKQNASPAVERVNAYENMRRNGGRWDYRGISAFFGKDTADEWAAPMLELQTRQKDRIAKHRAMLKAGIADPTWKDDMSDKQRRRDLNDARRRQSEILQGAMRQKNGLADKGTDKKKKTEEEKQAKTQADILKEVQTIASSLKNSNILIIEG